MWCSDRALPALPAIGLYGAGNYGAPSIAGGMEEWEKQVTKHYYSWRHNKMNQKCNKFKSLLRTRNLAKRKEGTSAVIDSIDIWVV